MFWSTSERLRDSLSLIRSVVIEPPTSEPITLSEAKRQVNLAESEADHDEHLILAIQAAREQWEADTDSAVMTQTVKLTLDRFPLDPFKLPKRPIQSIESISYYGGDGLLAIADPDIYSLDSSGWLHRGYGYSWPAYTTRRDAIEIVYVAGFPSRSQVPAVAKQAMLLLIGYWWLKNRGDNDGPYDMRAYEAFVARFMRSSYP